MVGCGGTGRSLISRPSSSRTARTTTRNPVLTNKGKENNLPQFYVGIHVILNTHIVLTTQNLVVGMRAGVGVIIPNFRFYIRASQASQKTIAEIPPLWRLKQADDKFQTSSTSPKHSETSPKQSCSNHSSLVLAQVQILT